MKDYAVAVTAKEKAELVEVGKPAELGPKEVRGCTVCSLISPGTELAWSYCGNSFPTYPGYAAVFEAGEIGAEAKGAAKGDLLFCMGGHRNFQQAEAHNTVRVPDGLAPEKAVLARLMGVSMTTLMTTAARPGDVVIVAGAGPVGYLAAQIFSLSGYEVILVEPDEKRRNLVRKACSLSVVDKIPADDKALEGKVALVVECSGHEQAVLDACRTVRKRGEVVLVGVPWRKKTDISSHDLLHAIFHKYAVLRSGWEWEVPTHSSDFRPHSIFSGYQTAMNWLARGKIEVDGLINMVSPKDAQNAYQDLLHMKSGGLFSVFCWKNFICK